MIAWREGDRVKLKTDHSWATHEANPAIGSGWECAGTVDSIDIEDDDIHVRWDNGETNVYYSHDLVAERLIVCHLPEELFEL